MSEQKQLNLKASRTVGKLRTAIAYLQAGNRTGMHDNAIISRKMKIGRIVLHPDNPEMWDVK